MLKLKNRKKSEEGMALIEAIPVLFMMVMLFNFSLGFFGAIHSGILNSIGAYNYTIETFRFRSNLMYFRPGVERANYKISLNRVHGVVKDGSEQAASEAKGVWPVTVREITFNYDKGNNQRNLANASESDRNYAGRTFASNIWYAVSNYSPQQGNSIQTPRIWIKTVYGICVTADCCTDGACQRPGE